MKKNKFILPFLLSTSCLASSIPFVTSCNKSTPMLPRGDKALTISANANSQLTLTVKDQGAHVVKPNLVNLEYSFDGSNWTKLNFDKPIDIKAGETLRLIGYNTQNWSEATDCGHFNLDLKGDVALGGELLALIDNGNGTIEKLPNNLTFSSLFEDDDAITSIEPTLINHVKADQNQSGLFSEMFYGCDGLTEIPSGLFNDFEFTEYDECTRMFALCSQLQTLPEGLFSSVKKFSDGCLKGMFSGCIKLESIPVLFNKNVELSSYCFDHMFSDCIRLENVEPNLLPWEELAANCYSNMFSGCLKLFSAPSLPAGQLSEQCYSGMFERCVSLIKMPGLPAHTLAVGCYSRMFADCYNLTTTDTLAIRLPAQELVENCYESMFNCSNSLPFHQGKVQNIEIGFTEWPDGCTANWLGGQSSTGTISSNAPWDKEPPSDSSHIPEGWTFDHPDSE